MAFNTGFYAYAIIGHTWADQLLSQLLMEQFDTFPIQCRHIEHMHEGVPANFVCRGYTVFTLCVRPSVTLCFLNILKSHGWIFIKPCKHVHICKTNFLDKKVRSRGQFYQSNLSVRPSVRNALFPLYLEESSLDFH